MKSHKVSAKTIRKDHVLVNDLNSLFQIPLGSETMVFYSPSLELSLLLDVRAALDLKVRIVTRSEEDYLMCYPLFETKQVDYTVIDGSLIRSIIINDDKQLDLLTKVRRLSPRDSSTSGLLEDAKRLLVSHSANETVKLIASAYINMVQADNELLRINKTLTEDLQRSEEKNAGLASSLKLMSADMSDFIKTYGEMQRQVSSRAILDVIKDTSTVTLPQSLTTLVIKNYGIPQLVNLVSAIKDSLTTSYDKHTKVIYISEADGVGLNELNRSNFFLLNGTVQASDLLKHDMFLCVGNVKGPIDFLLSTSTMDALIIVDSRRNTSQLIFGQTLTMYTAMDSDTATNLGLDPNLTITSSERSIYTLREADFSRKKKHALRNNELVARIVNSLVSGGDR